MRSQSPTTRALPPKPVAELNASLRSGFAALPVLKLAFAVALLAEVPPVEDAEPAEDALDAVEPEVELAFADRPGNARDLNP